MSARLTARDQQHLAVLRVTAMAADPEASSKSGASTYWRCWLPSTAWPSSRRRSR
jgi:hypothetical protein